MTHISLSDDHLVVNTPYDATQVAEIKQITGAKWDKAARIWRAPVSALHEIRAFAARHNLTTSSEVDLLTLPARPAGPTNGLSDDDDYISIHFPYDPVKVRMIKQIPGVTWHAAGKGWRAPKTSLVAAIKWAEQFGLPVPPELVAEAAELLQRRDGNLAASRETDAEIVVPGLQGEPFPYQRAGIAYASRVRRCFIADDMGLGKTIQGIGTLEFAHSEDQPSYPAVVICPPKLVLNWGKEWAKWMPSRKVVCVTDRKSFPDSYDVVVVGWSNITHWADRLKNHRGYVFDESHSAKNPQAQRTKAAVKITKSAPKDALILMLTGTPITNRPAEYAPQLQILGKIDKFGGLYGYYRSYCAAFKDRWGHWHIDGASNLDELNDRLRGEGLYVRRTKDQVLKELPPVLHDKVVVEGSPAAMKEYLRAEADIIEYLVERAKQIAAELGLSPASAAVRAKMAAESNEHLVRISVLRRLAARAKMETLFEMIDAYVESGQKVVVAAHHRDVVDEIAVRYGDLRIQGGQSVESVEAAKARFQAAPCEDAPVIVLSMQAAKEGHTLTAAQNVIFVELPWTPADVDQTYSRCHRIGQTGSVRATYLLCANTVDEEIHELLTQKRRVVQAAVDGGSAEDVDVGKQLLFRLLDVTR